MSCPEPYTGLMGLIDLLPPVLVVIFCVVFTYFTFRLWMYLRLRKDDKRLKKDER